MKNEDDKGETKSEPPAPRARSAKVEKEAEAELAMLEQFEADDKAQIPPWVGEAAKVLIHQAEALMPGKTGKQKRQWARNALLALLMAKNIREIPDWLELPAKRALAGLIIDTVFSLTPFAKKAEGDAQKAA